MSENSFPKEFRLLKAGDFSFLREGSRSHSTKFFRFYYKPSKFEYEHARLGISVSKKVGNACYRNYIKRLAREVFRNSKAKDLPYDFFLIASPRLKTLSDKSLVLNEVVTSFSSLITKRF